MSVYYQLNGFDGLPEIFTQPSYTCVLSLLRKLKSFGSLEITGRRAVDGLFDITFHYFSHCSRKFTTYYYTFSYRSHHHQTRYCVDISVYHRYIGDGSVYRRSFKDKFVTIRAIGDQMKSRIVQAPDMSDYPEYVKFYSDSGQRSDDDI